MSEHRRRNPSPEPNGQPPRPEGRASSPAQGGPATPQPGTRAEARRGGRAGNANAQGAASGPGRGGGGSGGGRGRGSKPPPRKPGRRRWIDYPRYGKSGIRRWLPSWKQVLSLCLLFVASLVGLVGLAYAMVTVPNPNAVMNIQNNIYYYNDGQTEIGRSGQVNRQNVGLDQVPKQVQQAVLAAENRTFYSDSGVSLQGLLRAAFNMAKGGDTQGGSTITQQYVKNYYLTQQQSVSRKFKEIFIAIKLDRSMSKDQILEGYLNTSFYGRNSYGIQAAAQAYYGKDAKDLTLSEGAYIATLLNAPGIYDVSEFPGNIDRVKGRWNYILDGMVKQHWLTPQERAAQQFEMPITPKPAQNKAGQAGYLMTTADNYLTRNNILTAAELARGGYKIVTTFDKNKQQAAVDAVNKEQTTTLQPATRDADKYVRTAIASVVPGDGAVVALYGGPDFLKQEYNDATRQDIQVGSTFKAFVLAAALRDGDSKTGQPISPDSIYDGDNNIPIKMPNGSLFADQSGVWHVTNESNASNGPISIRTAMDRSVNSVFAQLAANVGFDKVAQAAEDAGVPADAPDMSTLRAPVMALGVETPSALDMADAYATFAAQGKHADPYFIKDLKHNGDEVPLPAHKTKQVFTPQVANMVTDVLKGVIYNPDGTGSEAKYLGRPAAGKTGTTDENKSAWFDGYTPDLATAVGLFRQDVNDPRQAMLSMHGVGGQDSVHGGAIPCEIWTNYMKEALGNSPIKDFPPATPIGDLQNVASPSMTAPPSSTTPSPSATQAPPPTSDSSTANPSDSGTAPSDTGNPRGSNSPTDTSSGWNGGGWNGGGNGGGGGRSKNPTCGILGCPPSP